jgi:cell division control protein 6
MVQKDLDGFFESYLKRDPLFLDKKIIQSNYTPEDIPHREKEIEHVANILAPALRLERPSNIFIYGKTGTGKTLTVRYVLNKLQGICDKKKIDVKFVYINCKLKRVADTEYRLIAQIIRDLGTDVPATGLPTDEVYKLFFDILPKKAKLLILILDEIDQLVTKAGDEILYNLTRINSELQHSQISIIGISNDLIFSNNLDPRVKSSLSEEEFVFAPYNAIQLQDILRNRSKQAFRDDSIEEGVIEKCAAFAAREHGDARRALELLRVAGELAERLNSQKLMIKHLDMAEEKIERDRLTDVISTQPKQHQVVLYSIFKLSSLNKTKNIFTGDVYEFYKTLSKKTNLRPLTQRRFSDIVAELDMLGIICAKVISKGRYGRTREISIDIPSQNMLEIEKLLEDVVN